MSKNQDVTEEMFKAYSALHTPHLILRALMAAPGVYPLKLVIVGKQGTGKTAFAYYSAKVALGLRKCVAHSISLKDTAACLKFLREEYGLCLGRDCPQDDLDKELRRGMYVTLDDLLKRFVKDISRGAVKDHKMLFFDDAVMPGTYWNLGGEWRAVYHAFREFERFYRDLTPVLIITAPTLHHVDRAYKSNAVIYTSDIIHRREDGKFWNVYTKVVLHRVVTPNGIRTMLKPEYIDMVIHKAAFGMPEWLEEKLKERRYAVLKAAAEKALRILKKYEESDNSRHTTQARWF